MVISEEVKSRFTLDPEANFFLSLFDEPSGLRILEVGAHDVFLSTILAESGHWVTSVDLRPYDGPADKRHSHLVGDFCDSQLTQALPRFNCVICVSALEHFGLGTYGEGAYRPYYDVIAARRMYDLLVPGGTCYLTVPFGGRFVEKLPHWRVYDWSSVLSRLVQDFFIQQVKIVVCEEFSIANRVHPLGEDLLASNNLFDALCNTEGFPGVSVGLKLWKKEK